MIDITKVVKFNIGRLSLIKKKSIRKIERELDIEEGALQSPFYPLSIQNVYRVSQVLGVSMNDLVSTEEIPEETVKLIEEVQTAENQIDELVMEIQEYEKDMQARIQQLEKYRIGLIKRAYDMK